VTAILGGAFDPPHNGHVALALDAGQRFGQPIVLVSARPGHKPVETPVEIRLRLAEAAFPELRVELDEHPRTVDLLRERSFDQPLIVIGADQFADFLAWKEPEAVLELAELAVATRPGYPREGLDEVLARLDHPERVHFFEIEPLQISSRSLRERVARGEPIAGLVPPPVERLIDELGLYRNAGTLASQNRKEPTA
jgi:nicotinate-nucleotide adenylyltransferase